MEEFSYKISVNDKYTVIYYQELYEFMEGSSHEASTVDIYPVPYNKEFFVPMKDYIYGI